MAEQLFEIQTDKIVNGSKLMFDNENLTSWVGDLTILTRGDSMFQNCTNLTTFTSDLPSLTNGISMFGGCSKLASFSADLSSLTQGGYMFSKCYKLASFSFDLSSLTQGDYMFNICSSLTSFNSNLSSLTSGSYMFHLCPLDAPSVKNIALTINKNVTNTPRFDIGVDSTIANDEQVKKDLGLIKHKGWNLWINGSNLPMDYTLPKYAGCTDINAVRAKDANYLDNDIVNGVWSQHLPNLVTGIDDEGGPSMFEGCTKLTSFTADLSSLVQGVYMFHRCTNLTTFTSNLSTLQFGSSMFKECSNLTSFDCVDLSSLSLALGMFSGCTNLSSFNANLSSLTNGQYMFSGCSLSTESLKNIAKTINDLTSSSYVQPRLGEGSAWIDIDIENDSPSDIELTFIEMIQRKGWTVCVNGTVYNAIIE